MKLDDKGDSQLGVFSGSLIPRVGFLLGRWEGIRSVSCVCLKATSNL